MNDEVEEEKHDHTSNSTFTSSPSASSPSSQAEVEDEEPNEPKLQHTTSMQDHKIIKVNQIEDLVSHFALFSGHDPVVFQMPPKSQSGRRPWIKKNTWELTNIPTSKILQN